MTSRLDSSDFQNLFQVLRNKVADSQTDILECTIHYQILQDSPEFSNLSLLRDVRRVDKKEIRL
jgi:hypothetical protein